MRKSIAILIALIGCTFFVPRTAHATLQLITDSASYPQSPTTTTAGFVDMYFHVITPDSSHALAGYEINIDLVPVGNATGLTIVSVTNPSAPHTAIFPSNPPFDSSTTTSFQATEFTSTSVAITDQIGLVQLNYSLAPGAHGTFNLTRDANFNSLADANAQSIPYTGIDGTITIAPEPSSLCLLAAIGAIPLLRRRR